MVWIIQRIRLCYCFVLWAHFSRRFRRVSFIRWRWCLEEKLSCIQLTARPILNKPITLRKRIFMLMNETRGLKSLGEVKKCGHNKPKTQIHAHNNDNECGSEKIMVRKMKVICWFIMFDMCYLTSSNHCLFHLRCSMSLVSEWLSD